MTINEVFFVSRQAAEALVFFPDTAVISITDPGKRLAALPVWFRQVLRLSFYDAVPGDEFIPIPIPGCFDGSMAKDIHTYVRTLHDATHTCRLIVHCEEGVSRSAAVALFAAELTGAQLPDREKAFRANPWVADLLAAQVRGMEIDIPSPPRPEEPAALN
jgi:predicted protein tyrosine phosphatase